MQPPRLSLATWHMPPQFQIQALKEGTEVLFSIQEGANSQASRLFDKVLGWIPPEDLDVRIDLGTFYPQLKLRVWKHTTLLLSLFESEEIIDVKSQKKYRLLLIIEKRVPQLWLYNEETLHQVAAEKIANLDPLILKPLRKPISQALLDNVNQVARWRINRCDLDGEDLQFAMPQNWVCVHFDEMNESSYFEYDYSKTLNEMEPILSKKYGLTKSEMLITFKNRGLAKNHSNIQSYVNEGFFHGLVLLHYCTMQIFVKNLGGKNFTLEVQKRLSVCELRLLIKDKTGVPPSEQKLIYHGGFLKNSEFLRDRNIQNESWIEFSIRHRGGGPKTVPFADVRSDNEVRRQLIQDGPSWRIIRLGINWKGICYNRECQAVNKEVIVPKGIGDFDFRKESTDTHCPACKTCIDIINCSFFNCHFYITGATSENQIIDRYGSAPDDSVTTFRTAENDPPLLNYQHLRIRTYSKKREANPSEAKTQQPSNSQESSICVLV